MLPGLKLSFNFPSSPNLECNNCRRFIFEGLNLNGKLTLLALIEGVKSLNEIFTVVLPNLFVGKVFIHRKPPGINSVNPRKSSWQATANLNFLPSPDILISKVSN